jgi:hypothetical protein
MIWNVGNFEVSYGMNDLLQLQHIWLVISWIHIQCTLHKWKTLLTSMQTFKTILKKGLKCTSSGQSNMATHGSML